MNNQPPQWSPQPPPRPPLPAWRRGFSWYRGARRPVQISIAGAFALLLLCICLAGIGAANSANQGASTPTAAPVVHVSPTATPVPVTRTPTPSGPHLLTSATLGGLQSAFQSKYGQPSGTGSAKTFTFSQGYITATPSRDASSDGQQHIASLRIGPPSGAWNASTATPICVPFLPPDAQFQQTINVPGYGPERVYVSADLAATFPPDAFSDGTTGNAVMPGTFAMELGANFPLNTGCIIILGS